jgi:hypothetical protein
VAVRTSDRGAALVLALLMTTVLGVLVASVTMLTVGETRVSATYRHGGGAQYAAEIAIALALQALDGQPDWNAVLRGEVVSAFTDGATGGQRQTAVGPVDLSALTNLARCDRSANCTTTAIGAVTAERPWGSNNPVWQPFVFGSIRELLNADSDAYVVVWVADDPAECDGRPDVDGDACPDGDNAGSDVLALRAVAFGLAGVAEEIEATAGRLDGGRLRLLSWRRRW